MPARLLALVLTPGFGGLVACAAQDTTSESPGAAGAGADSRGGGGGGNVDEQALLACESPEPCPQESFVQLVEGSCLNVSEGARCVLTALAQRTPGRYRYVTESAFGNGSARTTHTLLVAADGSLAYARASRSSLAAELAGMEPEPGQRCRLRSPRYFEDCLAALAATSRSGLCSVMRSAEEAWDCSYGDGQGAAPSQLEWFESCQVETPLRCG